MNIQIVKLTRDRPEEGRQHRLGLVEKEETSIVCKQSRNERVDWEEGLKTASNSFDGLSAPWLVLVLFFYHVLK